MKIITLFLLFISLNAYSQRIYNDSLSYANYKKQDSKRSKKRYKFNSSKYKNRIITNLNKSKLDFEAVYYCFDTTENEHRIDFYFFRFFKSGEVFFSSPYSSMPDSIELNQLNYGTFRFYTINSRGEIIIEFPVKDLFLGFMIIIDSTIQVPQCSSTNLVGFLQTTLERITLPIARKK